MMLQTAKTALEYAFGLAGGPTRAEARFTLAIAEFFNNGGTVERAHELLDDAAERLTREGHSTFADDGQVVHADARLNDTKLAREGLNKLAINGLQKGADARQAELPSEGQLSLADNGHQPRALARQAEIAEGEGHIASAESPSLAAPPLREPSAADIAAMGAARKMGAKSIFDREMTRTGQAWGNVKYVDLDSFVTDADIALAIKHYIGALPRGADRLKTIRELMTPGQFAAALRKAKRNA